MKIVTYCVVSRRYKIRIAFIDHNKGSVYERTTRLKAVLYKRGAVTEGEFRRNMFYYLTSCNVLTRF